MPSRIEEAAKGTPVAMVMKVVDPLRVEAFVSFLLTKEVADMWNGDARLNLQPHQVPTIARMLLETFKNESLADFTICFRRGVMGLYSDDRDKLLRIDGSIIIGWMRKYLEEKYQVIESELMKQKDDPYAVISRGSNPERNLLALLKEVVGDNLPKSDNNADENEYQRKRLENRYSPPGEDYIKQKKESIRRYQEKALREKYPNESDEQIQKRLEKLGI